MMAHALTPWGLTRWIPTEHLVFSSDTAHDPLWQCEETLPYRKKSALCSWRAY